MFNACGKALDLGVVHNGLDGCLGEGILEIGVAVLGPRTMAALPSRIFGPRCEPTVGAIVFGIGEAMDVAGFGGDDGPGDVADAGDRDQELERGGGSQPGLEVGFEGAFVLADLAALLMEHEESHCVLFGEGEGRDEVRKSGVGGGAGEIDDVELGQDARGVLHQDGTFVLHDHALT